MPVVRRDLFVRLKTLPVALAVLTLLGGAALGVTALMSSAHAQSESAAPDSDHRQRTTPGAETQRSEAGHGDDSHAEDSHGDDSHGGHPDLGKSLGFWTVIPFVVLLLCIAVLPLTTPHWWEHNSSKAYVAFTLGLAMAAYLIISFGGDGLQMLSHTMQEYVSFIMLLGALYVISGGIFVARLARRHAGVQHDGAGHWGADRQLRRHDRRERAADSTAVACEWSAAKEGTHRDLLHLHRLELRRSADRRWAIRRCSSVTWRVCRSLGRSACGHWLIVNGTLLVIFYIWDVVVFNREEAERPGSQLEEVQHHAPLGILGGHNFAFLLAIVAIIYCSGTRHRQRWHALAVWHCRRADARDRAGRLLQHGERVSHEQQIHVRADFGSRHPVRRHLHRP